jgi:hypothetical protein
MTAFSGSDVPLRPPAAHQTSYGAGVGDPLPDRRDAAWNSAISSSMVCALQVGGA